MRDEGQTHAVNGVTGGTGRANSLHEISGHTVRRGVTHHADLHIRSSAIECVDPGHLAWAPRAGFHQRPRMGPGFAPAGPPSNRRPSRDVVNPADKVTLHRNRTSPPTNTPTSRKNTASTTKEYRYQRLSTQNSYFQVFMNSGTHATNVGKSGRLLGGPETHLPMIVGWCWKCMVG